MTDFWTDVRSDDRLARARRLVSMDELRMIAQHAWRNPVDLLWHDAETAPQTGFFLAWSPDHPDLVMTWKGEIFHHARRPGTPRHLSASHFTKWMPIPLPEQDK